MLSYVSVEERVSFECIDIFIASITVDGLTVVAYLMDSIGCACHRIRYLEYSLREKIGITARGLYVQSAVFLFSSIMI